MNFSDFLSKVPFISQSKVPQEFYFGLYIEEDSVEGCVWGVVGKHLRIISSAKAVYSGHQELIEVANQVLDSALADFLPEPNKVLFGVPDAWLQDDNLKEDYLKLLRHLVKELDVIPMAYVSTTHAVSHLLQKQAGVPTTSILVGVFDPLVVTVVKAGKIIGTKYQPRGADLADDIAKALSTFADVEVLPSKMTIYGTKPLDEFKDKLLSYAWIPKLPFLHLPKIEILSPDAALSAVCLAGAAEIFPEVIYSAKLLTAHVPEQNKHGVIKPSLEEMEHHPGRRGDLEEVGFVAGDIEGDNLKRAEEDYMTAVDEDSVVLRGRGREVSEYEDHHPVHASVHQEGGILGKLSGILASLPIPRFPGGLMGKLPLVLPVVLLGILIGGYVLLPKAEVSILIDPKVLQKDAQVIADPKVDAVDENSKTIPGKIVETDEQGSDKAPATGKKQVGESAKGGVIVYNLSANKVTLSQGTVLSGPNNLRFSLDTSVQIASQSSTIGPDFTTVTTPGKANSGVTAQAIGPDSNLPAGTKLTVAGYADSAVVAKVDSALTGGTSKDVQVVTADDQNKLLASLTSTLRLKAQSDLQGKLSGDQKILSEALLENIVQKSFSKKAGDQASEVALNLTVHYKGTTYSEGDLKSIVSKLVVTDVPDGFDLDLNNAETQADVGKLDKDGKLIFNAQFKANLTPKMDLEKIKKSIAFKTPAQAADYLKTIENVVGSEFHFKPSFPGPLQRLPILIKNISIEVKPK